MTKQIAKSRPVREARPASSVSKTRAAAKSRPFRLTYATMFDPPLVLHEALERAPNGVNGRLARDYSMWIGGEARSSAEGFQGRSPINTSWLVATFPSGTGQDAADAVAAARTAFTCWTRRP
jgi:1-pyrroline-5-carboxylate dehydrogenase